MNYFQKRRWLRWMLAILMVVTGSYLGHAQSAVPSVQIKAVSQGQPCPETMPGPGGSGAAQLVDQTGRPFQPPDTRTLSKGEALLFMFMCMDRAWRAASVFGEEFMEEYPFLFLVVFLIMLVSNCGGAQSQALPPPLFAQIEATLAVQEGAGRFKVEESFFAINIQTETTSITSVGVSDFTVGHDPSSRTSTVAAYSGSVKVQPTNPALQSVTLQPGQQVQVTRDSISPVTPIGAAPGPGPSPPPTGGPSSLKNFDANSNDRIDNEEFFAIIDAWIAGQLDNATFFKATDLWISQQPISSAQVNPRRLHLDSVTLAANPARHTLTFVADGQGITSMSVEIFDLNGQRVFAQETAGPRLTWDLSKNDSGHVANGVYLYVATVSGFNGEVVRSPVKKLMVLR